MFDRVLLHLRWIMVEIGLMVIAYFLVTHLFWEEDKINSLLRLVTMFVTMWLADNWITKKDWMREKECAKCKTE